MATKCSGQPLNERGKDGPVLPSPGVVVGWCGGTRRLRGAARGARVLCGGRATRQQDQPEHLTKIKYGSRSGTPGSCPTSDHRWSATQARLLAPHRIRGDGESPDRVRPCFTAPTFQTFIGLVVGLIAQTRRRTVCGMLTGAGLD